MYDHETTQKMVKIRALTDTILRARDGHRASPTYEGAVAIQQLERQRKELRALLPPLHVVN